MLRRLRQTGLLWPTLAALAGLVVLVGLGNWQLERKAWKEDLIAKIAARVHAAPVPLPTDVATNGKQDLEYLHVIARGRFHHDKERYLYAPTPAGLSWHVYTPLELPSHRLVWVNRGLVPDGKKAPEVRSEGQVPGEVEVRGLVRLQISPGLFAAQNDPVRNIWYWPDLPAMTVSAFPGGPQEAGALPLAIDADAQPEPPGGLPKGGVTRLQIPNRHLEYALTWYSLALTLLCVYLAFVFSGLRPSI